MVELEIYLGHIPDCPDFSGVNAYVQKPARADITDKIRVPELTMHFFRHSLVHFMLRVALQPHVCNSPIASYASPGGRPLEIVPVLDLPILPYRLAACRAQDVISAQVDHTTLSHNGLIMCPIPTRDQASSLLRIADLQESHFCAISVSAPMPSRIVYTTADRQRIYSSEHACQGSRLVSNMQGSGMHLCRRG